MTPTADAALSAGEPPRWSGPTRIAFRFCVLYFSLYVLSTQMLGSLVRRPLRVFAFIPPVRDRLVTWTATHVFGIAQPLVIVTTGSGDRTYDWVLAFCLVCIATGGAVVWSLLDRGRRNDDACHKWFHIFARLALGATMIEYGMVKVIPLQMPQPFLSRLIEPFGNFSPMGVLWNSIGASRPYEMFAGAAELLGGILLFVPRTALLGAVVSLLTLVQVFALNMTYDVPVKLFSLHLILLDLFILAPDAGRLANVLILNRPARPAAEAVFGRDGRLGRAVTLAQLLFAAYILGMNVRYDVIGWYSYGAGAPRPPLYGIWNVDEMSRDGKPVPPLLSDRSAWRRLVIQLPAAITFQRMDDTTFTYGSAVDLSRKTVTLNRGSGQNWKAELTFEQPAPDRLILDGSMDGHALHVTLSLNDRSKFLLVSRGFNWIQEYPFNR